MICSRIATDFQIEAALLSSSNMVFFADACLYFPLFVGACIAELQQDTLPELKLSRW